MQEKDINVLMVKAGDKINIDKNTYFDILWPDNNLIQENSTNNNSIVANLVFNKFKILYTGDIGEVAENEIYKKYQNTNRLECSILKVSHHGSKTSSTEYFLNAVKPQIALMRSRRK
ncbi:MAG: ComEC/Rec2 family competence protein [Candidatus Scatovivens sp.]